MRGHHLCPECKKSLASSQSLWNHKQRCNAVGRGTTVSTIDAFLNEITTDSPTEDLLEKFMSLFSAYWLDKEHKNRGEILSVLEQLYQKGDISNETYDRVFTLVAPKDDNFASTIENLIESDKSELLAVLSELKTDSTKDIVTEIEKLFEDFIRGEANLPKIHKLLEAELYDIVPKYQIFRIKILLKNIVRIQQRINDIVNIFKQTPADKKSRLLEFKRMLRQELISTEQYLKLVEAADEIEMNELLDIIQK